LITLYLDLIASTAIAVKWGFVGICWF